MADTDKLARLAFIRAQEKELQEEAERIKLELMADHIDSEGQVYFTDYDGEKRRGWYSDAEKVEVNLAKLRTLVDEETYNLVTKERAVDVEAFRAAMKSGQIPPDVAALTTRITRWRPTIRFDQPE